MGTPACPKPTTLTQSKAGQPSDVVVASIPSFTVGVACNGWPPAPTSSHRPPPHLPVLGQVTTSRPAPTAFDRPRRDAPTLLLSRKTAAQTNYQPQSLVVLTSRLIDCGASRNASYEGTPACMALKRAGQAPSVHHIATPALGSSQALSPPAPLSLGTRGRLSYTLLHTPPTGDLERRLLAR